VLGPARGEVVEPHGASAVMERTMEARRPLQNARFTTLMQMVMGAASSGEVATKTIVCRHAVVVRQSTYCIYCALIRFSSSALIAASILLLTALSRARTSASGSRSTSLTRPARYSSRSSSRSPC
jgi:hypothetical protein